MTFLRDFLAQRIKHCLVLVSLIPVSAAAAPCTQDLHRVPLQSVLPNGLQVVVVCDPVAPIVTSVMTYMVGSADVPENLRGIAHAQEHMMFRGTPNLTEDQLANIGALLGGRYNAVTREHFTRYYYTVPADLLNVVLHVEATRLRDVSDAPAAWSQEKAAVAQEISLANSSPVFLFTEKARKQAFGVASDAGGALGTAAALDTITPELLKQFYRRWYVPNNATLVVVGKVDPDETLAAIRTMFDGIAARPLPDRLATHRGVVDRTPIQQNTDLPFKIVALSFRMPGANNPDYPAARLLLDVMNDPQSPLTQLTVKGQALASTFLDLVQLPEADLGTAWVAYPAQQTSESILSLLRPILAAYATTPLPAELVEAVKRRDALAFELSKASIEEYAISWADAVTIRHERGPEELSSRMQRVSPEDLLRVARTYLSQNAEIVGQLNPGDVGTRPMAAPAAEVLGLANSPETSLPLWASRDLMHLRVPPSPEKKSFTLHNGLKLVVLTESNTKSISVYGHVRTNASLAAPEGKEGVDALLGTLFGTGSSASSRDALQDRLKQLNATANFGDQFSLVVAPDALRAGLQVLSETELGPRLTEAGFQSAKEQLTVNTAAVLSSPYYQSEVALRKAMLPATDPDNRFPSEASVKSLSLGDVQRYFVRVFRPERTTIVVIGDITPRRALAAIEQSFGGWKSALPAPDIYAAAAPANAPVTKRIEDAHLAQTTVTLAETVPVTRKSADYAPLVVGDTILSGASYASMFSKDIRESRGLVYSIYTALNVTEARGEYRIQYGCDPREVDTVKQLVMKDLRVMTDREVTAAELFRAQSILVRGHLLAQADIAALAAQVIAEVENGDAKGDVNAEQQRYLEVTPPQIKATFEKAIHPQNFVEVILGPPDTSVAAARTDSIAEPSSTAVSGKSRP